MENSVALPAAKVGSWFAAINQAVNAFWALLKIGLLVGLVAWAWAALKQAPPEAGGMARFLALSSPLETTNQNFSIGSHKMPPLAVLAALPEAERVANPSLTAAQLQRAKWLDRTWNEVQARNESNRALSNASKGFVAEKILPVVGEVIGKKEGKTEIDIADLVSVNVLVGNEVVPSLASGLLPVFSDAETLAWKAELARSKIVLNELDMRRAKYFQAKFGPGSMPPKAPADVEIRAAEKLAYEAQPVDYFGRRAPLPTASLSDNERLEAACNALNIVANPALIPAAPVAAQPAAARPTNRAGRLGGL